MDKRLQDLVDWTKEKLKLDSYFLKTSSIQRKVNTYQETVYTLCMEWFPLHKPITRMKILTQKEQPL